MIEQNLNVEQQKDFYKFKLIEMGYYKTPEGLQLYELSLSQLEGIYKRLKFVERCRIDMAYSREEQETTMVFDNSSGQWSVYSTVPKHIRKLANLCELQTLEEEAGRLTAVKGVLQEKQVTMKNLRVMTEEQRQKAAERLSKARNVQK